MMNFKAVRWMSVAMLLAGCGDDPAPATDAGTDVSSDLGAVDAGGTDTGVPIPCDFLGGYCHDVDPGSGPIHECHEGGHEANPTWCSANLARCYDLCTAARNDASVSTDATAHTDATAGDGGTTPAQAAAVACSLVGSYCHSADPGSGPIHECHEEAHDGDATWCSANAGRCYNLCRAALTDGGVADAGAAPDALATACTLLGSYCHSVDPGSGPIHECHEGAHDGETAWCSANVQRCYDLCRTARLSDAGASTDAASAGDAAHH